MVVALLERRKMPASATGCLIHFVHWGYSGSVDNRCKKYVSLVTFFLYFDMGLSKYTLQGIIFVLLLVILSGPAIDSNITLMY